MILGIAALTLLFALWPSQLPAQPRGSELILAYPGVGGTSTIIIAAQKWGFFSKNKLNVQPVLMRSSIANAAMMAGEMSYFAGVGPASVSATLSGMPSKAVWVTGDRLTFELIARPAFKTVADLKSKKLGVIGLGGTNHVSLVMALEKSGVNPKDFIIISVPAEQSLQALEAGHVDAFALSPPFLVQALSKGYRMVLDIGALVEMPVGGLTVMAQKLRTQPDEVKRVIMALQQTKLAFLKSEEEAIALFAGLLNMDRQTAAKSYELLKRSFSANGIPTRIGMENIVKSIQAAGRFTGRNIPFEEIADATLASQVARELGYKVE
ncbi:MAG TPA: ABC transporter substrate-binding protein [Methylomirabilota bacterium]|nr:ABC transporter substrate-binding protein [Methylomirabilota bacterium]